MSAKRVVVVGGANVDVGAVPAAPLRLHDSNPGEVRLRPGGVGRNIAHDLRLLGLEVSLVTALGDDPFGALLRQSCEALGIDLGSTLVLPGARTSSYLYVTDGGDMHVGVSDMDVTDRLDPAALAPLLPQLNAADAVVLDANLRADTVDFLAAACTAPLYADPVSAAKAPRLRVALPRLTAVKPNALEAAALTGETDPALAARALCAAGVKRAFVSLGAEGLVACEGETLLRLPCRPCRAVNATGAGDAAVAAIVWAGLRGLSLEETARAALAAGAQTVACAETNPPSLTLP